MDYRTNYAGINNEKRRANTKLSVLGAGFKVPGSVRGGRFEVQWFQVRAACAGGGWRPGACAVLPGGDVGREPETESGTPNPAPRTRNPAPSRRRTPPQPS